MFRKLHKKAEGFTIIEVLIVLAIAGLILLIVFLAVPALQRNSRNTSYRNEASQLLAAAQEYANNNNGTLPGGGTTPTASSCTGVAVPSTSTNCNHTTSPNEAQKVWQLTKNKNIVSLTVRASTNTGNMVPTLDTARYQAAAKCGTGTGSIFTVLTSGVPEKSSIIVYGAEDSSGAVVAQCIES